LEFPGLAPPRRLAASLIVAASLGLAATPAAASTLPTVAGATTPVLAGGLSGTPVLVSVQNKPPAGYRLTAAEVERIAFADHNIRATVKNHRGAYPAEYTHGPGQWQVSWFTPKGKEIAQVFIYDPTGKIEQAWTGFQVAWSMARGYPGAFGRRVNAWYVWVPLCLLFMAPFIPWRLPRARHPASPESAGRQSSGCRGVDGRRAWSLLHVDLAVLLGFSISLAFFNHGNLGMSVPLAYPFLLYLLVRMLALAFGRGRPRTPLRLTVPVSWLVIGMIFLVGFRIGLNVTNSNVIDVGYAGVIGAHKLVNGQHLYGHWPADNAEGDTYGPVNYYAYVPAYAVFGWSGAWDDLPAAHAAAILFDLLTLLGLVWLGRRIRGPTLGWALGYAWAAYPFTLYALSSNSNDSLVALLIVAALLVITSPPARGVLGALAGLTKFAPLALAPLLIRGTGPRPRARALFVALIAYGLTALVVMLPVLLDGNLHAFWNDTISYQAARGSPFSIWGLWGGLSFEQHVVQGAAAMLAVVVAVIPGRRTLVEVAALGAAVLIGLQLSITHWFYLYIVWFFPLVMVALLASHPAPDGAASEVPEAPAAEVGPAPRVAVAGRAAVA
jgi:hypothetical protein